MAKAAPKPRPEDDDPKPEPPRRVSRHVQPLGPRVLVRVLKSPDRSEAGLFLPQGVKDDNAMALLGEVVEVARTMPKVDDPLADETTEEDDDHDRPDPRADLGRNVSGVPLHANVLFEKDRGVAVPWDETLRIIEVRHILALVDIISEDEIQ
ncbi:co-chaperone GroES [Paraliomyxa miuraensis]|uniref:co-chaperone GroES n=1 Tax=Paraliomyxa miuraensis TaxID=376150 RepID=UPI00224FD622|nr:co-chaperone GroES [Paraliomyxa miuraensis]MCX4239954.1 co-chaperone GroES [Paraliomyxa miuraensis]